MRKLIVFNLITTDGYFEGKDEDISWHRIDEEVNGYLIEQMKTADTLLFGRKTFEIMEYFWPTKEAFELDPVVSEMMNNYNKIVFSTMRSQTTWGKTGWVQGNIVEKVKALKNQQGKDMLVFGSAGLCKSLIKHNLIDEFRLMINPVTLGSGRPFFHTKMNLNLLKTKVFGNGNVLLCYRPVT